MSLKACQSIALFVIASLGRNAAAQLTEAPPLTNFPSAAADQPAACLAISSSWPGIIAKTEAAFRTHQKADYEAGKRRLDAWFDAQAAEGCPPWPMALAVQRAMLDEFAGLFDITRSADIHPSQVAGRDVAQIGDEYLKLNDEACVRASTRMETAWRVYLAEDKTTRPSKRRQRYVTNLQTDASVVQLDGRLGAPLRATEHFVALAHTEVLSGLSGQLDSLQGQGPYGAKAARDYVAAARHYAGQHAVERTVFVNAAGGQVPSFAKQVTSSATNAAGGATYVQYDGWKDGCLVTPKQAADFTEKLVRQSFDPHKKTLLVVNCNAGLDRSGTINALAQLMVTTRTDLTAGMTVDQAVERGFAAIPKVVWQLKQARPHSISSVGRYIFIYESYASYAEALRGA